MAIKKIKPGKTIEPAPDDSVKTVDYTHLLPLSARRKGYRIVASTQNVKPGAWQRIGGQRPKTMVVGRLLRRGTSVGHVEGLLSGKTLEISEGVIYDASHRGGGKGTAMYEAALAHAWHEHGATRVRGGEHSTQAEEVHRKLAAKHKIPYKPNPNLSLVDEGHKIDYANNMGITIPEDTHGDLMHERINTLDAWKDMEPGSYDSRFGSYNYAIKSESDEIFEQKIRKSAKPLVIPDRYRDIQLPVEFVMDPNLLETEIVAKAQMGFNANIQETFEAAKMVSGGGDIPLSRMIKAYHAAEDDIEKAALEAYGIQHTHENLSALHTSLYGLSKALDVASVVQSYQIEPATQDATDMAEAIQRGAKQGYINPVKLNGKHSKGAMVVKDPVDRKMYLLKPGAGKNSPALGVSEDLSSQSEREAAFWHVADAVGLGEFYPKADLVLVNGHQTAAMELLPLNFRNLGDKKKEDPNIASRILTPYLKDGTLHQWALMDYLLGNPDRHSQNIMVDPKGHLVKLIDHGSAMAGNSFDPVNDPDSFIPYYLRAWTGRKFTTMSPKERMLAMPSMDPQTSKGYDIWVKDMPDHQIAAILEEYHVNPQPALRRLAQIRASPGPKWQVVNKLWAGST